jgi:hypothetical protein
LTEQRPAFARFLQSQLGLLIITSVLVPLITFSYHSWRDRVAAADKAATEKRIIVYRLDIIAHSLGQASRSHICRAFGALQGWDGCYQPLYPELESGIPLAGLIYRVLPEDALTEEGLPEPVEILSQIADMLLPLAGPDAEAADFAEAYPAHAQDIKILRERLLGQYPQLKTDLKLGRQ